VDVVVTLILIHMNTFPYQSIVTAHMYITFGGWCFCYLFLSTISKSRWFYEIYFNNKVSGFFKKKWFIQIKNYSLSFNCLIGHKCVHL